MTQPSPPTWLDAFFGSGYKVVVNGTNVFPSRLKLDLEGVGFSIVDDPTNDQTIITFTNGQTTTRTTASFVMPAVSANVTIPVLSTSSLAPGLSVFVAGAGYLNVASVTDGTHFVAENPGAPGNATPGTTIAPNALVIPSGPSSAGLPAGTGLVEVTGGAGSTIALGSTGDVLTMTGPSTAAFAAPASVVVKTTANFTQPAIGSSVAVAVTSSSGYAAGTWATVAGGGRYTVSAVPDGTHVSLVNRGGAGNASPGATVASGAVVSLAATEPLGVLGVVAGAASPFLLQPVNNVRAPEFGAKGDGVTDDTAAIVAADAAAAANNLPVYFPPGVYMVSAELVVSPGRIWMGPTSSDDETVIRASAPMRSVAFVRNTQLGTLDPQPTDISHLTFDANGLAQYAVLNCGNFLSFFTKVYFYNAVVDGERSAARRQAVGIVMSHSTPGGSPTGVAVTQPDPTLLAFFAAGVSTWVLKVQGGGTTFQLSRDGGSTYQTATQPLTPGTSSNIIVGSGAKLLAASGLRVSWPAGTYHDNDTYTATITVPGEDAGAPTTINADIYYEYCRWWNNGACFGSGALVSSGVVNSSHVLAGSVSTTSGSNLITGVGTSFLTSIDAREGDLLYVAGTIYPIAGVLDDQHLIVPPGCEPASNLSGQDYLICKGHGRFEDAAAENTRAHVIAGHARSNAGANWRFAGQSGPILTQARNELYGLLAYHFGSPSNQMQFGGQLLHPHVEFGSTLAESVYVQPGTAPLLVQEPAEFWTHASSRGAQRLLQSGVEYALGVGPSTLVPLYVESYINTPVTLSTAAQQIAAPSTTSLGTTTDIGVASVADFDSTAAPFFTGLASVPDGVMLQLTNAGFHAITFQHDDFNGSGLIIDGPRVTLGAGGWMRFRVKGGKARLIARQPTYAEASGNDGNLVPRLTTSSSSSTIVVYDVDVKNGGISAGTTVVWDLVAQSQSGTNNARWIGFSAGLDVAGNLTAVVAGTTIIDAGATALGWAMSWGFDVFGNFFQIRFAGDNSGNPVTVKAIVRMISAGT